MFTVVTNEMELIETQRGGIALIVDSMRFTIDRQHAATISWKCSIKSCKARLITVKEKTETVRTLNEHQHPRLSQQDIEVLKTSRVSGF